MDAPLHIASPPSTGPSQVGVQAVRRRHLLPLVLLLGGAVLLVLALGAAAQPPVSGDWVITTPEVLSGGGDMVNGSVIIGAGGSLTLQDGEVLVINCGAPGEFGLQVNASGTFRMLDGATLSSFDSNDPYTFEAQAGSTVELRESVIESAGFMLGPNGTDSGVVVRTSDATIVNLTIYDSYQGLVVDGATVSASGLRIQFVSWSAVFTNNATVTIDGLEVLGAAAGLRPVDSRLSVVEGTFALLQNGVWALNSTTELVSPLFLYANSDLLIQGGQANVTEGFLSVDGASQVTVVDNATVRLIDTSYALTSLFFDTNPNTTNYIEAWWTLAVTVGWKDGPAINGSAVTISDVTDTVLFDGFTDANGTIPNLVVRSVVMSEGVTTLLTPHNITVVADPYQLSTYPVILSPTDLPVEVNDWLAPTLQVDAPGTDAMLSSSEVLVNGSSDDLGSGVANLWLAIDSPQWVPVATSRGPFAYLLSNVSDGPHTLYFRLVDAVGNQIEAEVDFSTDTIAPEVVFVTPIDGEPGNDPTPLFSGYTESTATLVINQVVVDVDPQTGWFSFSNLSLEDGTSPVGWAVVDLFGNGANGTLQITVDTIAPTLTIGSPANGSTFNTNRVTVSGHADPESIVTINGTSISLLSNGDFTVVLQLAEGLQELELTAADTLGNLAIGTLVLHIDLTGPSLHLISPQEGELIAATTVNVTGVTEAGARVSVNGGPQVVVVTGVFSIDVPLSEGADTLQVAALDAAGNVATLSLSVVRDTIPPELEVNIPEYGLNVTAEQVTLTGTTDIGASVSILGDPVFVDSDGRFSQTVDLPQVGTLVVTLSATDRAGNEVHIIRKVTRVSEKAPTKPGDLVSTILDFNDPMGLLLLLIIIMVVVVLAFTAVSVRKLSKQSAAAATGERQPRDGSIDLGAERPAPRPMRAPDDSYGDGYREQRYPEAPQRYPEVQSTYEEPAPAVYEEPAPPMPPQRASAPPRAPEPQPQESGPEAFETSHAVIDDTPPNVHHETHTDDITSILSGLEPGAGHDGVRPAVLPLEARKGTSAHPGATAACPKCGEEVQPTWSICPYCDHRLKGGAPPTPPTPAPAATPASGKEPPKEQEDDLDSLLSSLGD